MHDALRQTFKPEFLNRVDDIIVYRPLDREDLLQIIDLQLKHVERLLEARGLHLEVDQGAKELLVGQGFDPVYGARPLKRVIQREVQNPLALAILEGKYEDGDTIRVSRRGETTDLEFARSPAPQVAEEPSLASV